jgi:hypothetical protein
MSCVYVFRCTCTDSFSGSIRGSGGPSDTEKLLALLEKDSLYNYSRGEKLFVWRHRFESMVHPDHLPAVLSCCNWRDTREVVQAHQLLFMWPLPQR